MARFAYRKLQNITKFMMNVLSSVVKYLFKSWAHF